MTKAIAALIVVIVLFIGWKLFERWQEVQKEDEYKQKQDQLAMDPNRLPGFPSEYYSQFEQSLAEARKGGAKGLGGWLAKYGPRTKDPRKAWIELDYCELLLREDIPAAKTKFREVKERTSKSSVVVWKRIQELQKTFE